MIYKNSTICGNEFNEGGANYTLVGSSVQVSDDGIASNFTTTSYIQLPTIYTNRKDFEINLGKIKSPSNNARSIIVGASRGHGFGIGFYNYTIYVTSFSERFATYYTSALTANTDYYIKGGVSGSNAYVSYSLNGTDWTTKTAALTNAYTQLNEFIGVYDGQYPPSYSIDLKQITFSVDGKVAYAFATNKASISSYQITANEFYEI